MPRTARSYDSAFASDAESEQKQNKATSVCELSSYEKLNSGQTDHDQGEGTCAGKSDASSGTSSPSPPSSLSSDESIAKAPHPGKNKNQVSLGGAGRHTKRLVDMKTAAAVATVHKSGSVGANKVAAASSTTKKAKGTGGRRSTNGIIGSAKKKGSTEKKAKKPAAATKKRKKQSTCNAKTETKDQAAAAPKPPASVAMPGRLVRISDYHRQMEPSPISSPIHRVNLTFTPEAMEAADSQKQKKGKGKGKGKKAADTVATGPSKKRSATMVSGGTGRFNIMQG